MAAQCVCPVVWTAERVRTARRSGDRNAQRLTAASFPEDIPCISTGDLTVAVRQPYRPMVGSLQDKTLIVTGAGGGIGRAASIVLAGAGANVVVSDIIEDAGRATVEVVQSSGGIAVFV